VKAKIFIGAVIAFVLALGAYAWVHKRERAAEQLREAAEARAAAERRRKAEEEQKNTVRDERAERAEEVRLNGPERLRLQRRYPESWNELQQRAPGVDLERCVVSAAGEIRLGENAGQGDPPSLSARCGDYLEKNF
jgi:uncharacterized protein HemX